MRKLFAIFLVSATVLFSILLCYADEQVDLKKDLPLTMRYETKQNQEQLDAYMTKAEALLEEQQLNLDILSSIYYMGYVYTGRFDSKSLERSISVNLDFQLNAPLYKSEIYKGYYTARTEKLLKQYSNSHFFDNAAFTKNARPEFDNYIKTALKTEAARRGVIVLLQEKLMDKLVEVEPTKRKAALDEIYSLSLPAKKTLCNDYLYQAFEYGVRAEILNQMAEMNKERLLKLSNKAAVRISSEKSGKLQLQYKTSADKLETVEILGTSYDTQGFNGFTVLGELYGKKDCMLVFTDAAGNKHTIDSNSALEALFSDDEGYLQLKLDPLLDADQPNSEGPGNEEVAQDKNAKINAELMKALEASYKSKGQEASAIIKELNRYSMYLELKNKGVSNYFTRKFESDKKAWKAAIDSRLNSFGSGGMADFAAYIKQFVMAGRGEVGKTDQGRLLIARFRNSVIQYRQLDDCSIWITDMLYNLKNMK